MAYYRVVDDFRAGMPQTVLSGGLRPRGIACHTTEGAEGERGALGTIQFLIDRADRNASYHEMWYPKEGGFEARRIVRPDRAAHSMNPNQPPWAPDARVRRILGDRWGDPNAYSYAVSIAGSTAVTVPALIRDPGFMAGARRRIGELMGQFKATLSPDPLFNHGEGQTNRSDWGPLMRPALVGGADMKLLPVQEDWNTVVGHPFYVDGPGVGTAKKFNVSESVRSVAESVEPAGNTWRLIAYRSGEVLWIQRTGLKPIAGTRVPKIGYGPPPNAGQVTIDPNPELERALTGAQRRITTLEEAIRKSKNTKNAATNAEASLHSLV